MLTIAEDLLLIVVPKGNGTLVDCKTALKDYQDRIIFDPLFSPNYYPNHPNFMCPA